MSNPELLYSVIMDFVEQNQMTMAELFGVFKIIEMEQMKAADEHTDND